jgi:hypothetical protein
METKESDSTNEMFNPSQTETQKGMKILPDLKNNIKCGNSLIGKDFLSNNLMIDNEEIKRVNPFDWKEAFGEIMENGGFDVVIGNPPYGAELKEEDRQHLDAKFNVGNTDTACLLLIQAKRLSKPSAFNGFIIPKAFTYASNWAKARNALIDDIGTIVDCSKVWKEVKLEMSIYIAKKENSSKSFISSIRAETNIERVGLIDKKLCEEFGFILNGVSKSEISVALKIKKDNKVLNDFVINQRGGIFQNKISDKGNMNVLGGKQIQRYFVPDSIKGKVNKADIEDDKKNFLKDNAVLVQRLVAHVMHPYPRIVVMAVPSDLISDIRKCAIVDTINQLENTSKFSNKYISAILNSKLICWYLYKFIFANAIRTMQFDNPTTSRIPMIDPTDTIHKQIVSLVDMMIEIQVNLNSSKTETDKKIYQQKADIVDSQINEIVYELYGLTKEEIKIIDEK